MQMEVEEVYAADEILQYIVTVVNASRHHPDLYLDASPRASIDLYRSGKALAYLRGRNYVLPDDIKAIAGQVLGHRMMLSPEARIEGRAMEEVVASLIKKTYTPVVKSHDQ